MDGFYNAGMDNNIKYDHTDFLQRNSPFLYKWIV